MHNRRDVLILGLKASLLLGVASWGSGGLVGAAAAAETALDFDASQFTELTATIATDAGDRVVVYRFYKAVPYVASPVDVAYQCLNVSVPVSIDGVAIDAANAPILFSNSIGGYMPSSVADATGIDASGMTGMPAGGPADAAAPSGTEVQSGGNAMLNMGERVSNAKLALAAGFVVVEPGARGRTLVDANGTYHGVAPAAIVDLKAAVRYLRHNKGRIPGNTDWIVSSGTSAGGALSALLGASGDSALYDRYLNELGAADASDAIFASGDWCPITDLEHADMAYEWNWGSNPLQSGESVDAAISSELSAGYADYLAGLGLKGPGAFGEITSQNYSDHLLAAYLKPAASRYLSGLSDADRTSYLADNSFISWSDGAAEFTWADFLSHVGARKKSAPAFDAFDLSSGENNEFGNGTTEARHFTKYSLRHVTGNAAATIDSDLPEKLKLMNPMGFIQEDNPGRSRHWWIRVGTKDSDTSLSVVGNLAAALSNRGDDVNALMYWDAGHGSNEDAGDFIAWISSITGYKAA
jgi:hypothetical protein